MYYTIYKITNQINGKFYIGSHKTKDLDDNYMGSGKYLKRAQDKDGIENFTRELLFVFDTPEEMYAKEAEIVNEDFLAEENTYNLKVGGFGGWDYINHNSLHGFSDVELARKCRALTDQKLQQKYGSEWRQKLSEMSKQKIEEIKTQNPNFFKEKCGRNMLGENNPMYGKTHSNETKKALSANHVGNQNSQYGTKWIHSLELKQSKKIKKDDPIPNGWNEGRKIKF